MKLKEEIDLVLQTRAVEMKSILVSKMNVYQSRV